MKSQKLFLVVKKEWYDKIASGEKRVEYRKNSEYWNLKFLDITIYKNVEFQCGYSRKYPRLKFQIENIVFEKTPEEIKKIIKTDYCFAIYLGDNIWEPTIEINQLYPYSRNNKAGI